MGMPRKKKTTRKVLKKPSSIEKMFFHMVEHAKVHGYCVLELMKCDSCGGTQAIGHPSAESVPCQKCGVRIASKSPRPRQRGEVTLEHVNAQLQTVLEANAASRHGEDSLKIEEFPPEFRSAVTAKCA